MNFSSSSVSQKNVNPFSNFYRHILLQIDPLFLQFVYFTSLSLLGFCLLFVTNPKANSSDYNPSNMDLFFMSVSAATTSSMSVVEMEDFSNIQLLILTFLMFFGGDIFISIVGLQCSISDLREKSQNENKVDDNTHNYSSSQDPENSKNDGHNLKYNSIHFLGLVVIGYFLVCHMLGFILIPIYLTMFPTSRNILARKGLNPFTFVVFSTVSTFTNCGFIPTNENMIVFKKNPGLLLILMPQILLGNTLYPPCLRFSIWFTGKFVKKEEAKYLLENPPQEFCYFYLLSARHSTLLVLTVLGFLLVQFVMFCAMEWNSEGLSELNNYERVIGVLFVIVNTRYSGETILDLWNLAPAIWVLFVFLMYIPPYTSYFGTNNKEEENTEGRNKWVEELMLSPLSYIVIFVILICITERKKMEEDPVNFNALSIVIEVIRQFKRIYMCLGAMKKGFKAGLRDFLGLNGAFMKGPFPGQVLTVVGVDCNNGIYLLAYAVVEAETTSNWKWFLECLGNDLELYSNSNFTLINDRQKGVVPAIAD